MTRRIALLLIGSLCITLSHADGSSGRKRTGTLTANQVIASEVLGYELQYRVYLPPDHEKLIDLPVLYVVDGQSYIEPGELPELLDRLIAKQRITPIAVVFVDSREPGNSRINRRNEQFFCNEKYAAFFTDELIPKIDATYPTKAHRDQRATLGLSFGGLNSACFGLLAYRSFGARLAELETSTRRRPDLPVPPGAPPAGRTNERSLVSCKRSASSSSRTSRWTCAARGPRGRHRGRELPARPRSRDHESDPR